MCILKRTRMVPFTNKNSASAKLFLSSTHYSVGYNGVSLLRRNM